MVETLAQRLQAVQAEASMAEMQPQELGAYWDKDNLGKDHSHHQIYRNNNPNRHSNHNNKHDINGNIIVNNNTNNNKFINSNNNINNSNSNKAN